MLKLLERERDGFLNQFQKSNTKVRFELWDKVQTRTIRNLTSVKIKMAPELGRWWEKKLTAWTKIVWTSSIYESRLKKTIINAILRWQSEISMSSEYTNETKCQMMWICLMLRLKSWHYGQKFMQMNLILQIRPRL